MPTLQDYQIDTAALLHDSNNLFTSPYQLTRWINQARDRVAEDSGCIRVLVAGQAPFGVAAQAGSAVPGGAIAGQAPVTEFFTIAGQEFYPFAFGNQTAVAQNRGTRAIVDVQNVAVSWGGSIRPVPNWMPWDQLQAFARSYNIGVFSYPFVWSDSGVGVNNRIWLWPAPSITSEMEWDVTMVPAPLFSNDDFEAIPDPFTGAVKYWAARAAFLSSFRNAQAADMEAEYWKSMTKAASVGNRGRIPDYYADWSRW